jgi:PRC-barrel domain protein
MKAHEFSFLDQAAAQELIGFKVVDRQGEPIGTMDGFWLDPSTLRVAFIGVKSSSFPHKTHVVPAAGSRVEENGSIRVDYSRECITGSPVAHPGVELAEVEEEEVNAYYGRFSPLHRTTSIEQVRPEEANKEGASLKKSTREDRSKIVKGEQTFFDQRGFVTDSMPEVDASKELRGTAEEAKAREQE